MKRYLSVLLFLILSLTFNGRAVAGDSLKILVVYSQLATSIKTYIASEDIKGATLAVDKINTRGGLMGHKLEIIDFRAPSALEATAEVERILKENDILAVIGANISNLTLALAPIFQEKGIPVISPISTNPDVTLIGDYIFRACFTDPFQGKVMAGFALKDLGAKTAVILTKINSKFSQGLSEYFRQAFSEQGAILWQGRYLIEDNDFSQIIENIKKLNPDVVFVPGHGRDVGLILKQARNMGLKTVFLGGDGWGKGVLGFTGPEAAEGNCFANHWHTDVSDPLSREFKQAYYKKYGENLIASSAALAYDSVMLLADAVERAGSLDRKKIRDALAVTRDLKGITGTYTFDGNGDPIDKDAVILKYQNGRIVYVKTIKQ